MNDPAVKAAHEVSINDVLERWSNEYPQKAAVTFLRDGEIEEGCWTYREFAARTWGIAQALRAAGVGHEPVLVVYPQSLEFLTAFLGVLEVGAIAVPAIAEQSVRFVERFEAVVRDAGTRFVVTTGDIKRQMQPILAQRTGPDSLVWIESDTILPREDRQIPSACLKGEHAAFIQYTSGSTGMPRGVVISHANLMYQQAVVQAGYSSTAESVLVSWLPLFHDMGLIVMALHALYLGARLIVMSPMAFLQKPIRWLKAVSGYGADISGGPNFAYEMCAKRITEEEARTLDLSRWHVAFNSSEPIAASTLQRFSDRFGCCGFAENAMLPAYGLAEATAGVSSTRRLEGPSYCHVDRAAYAEKKIVEVVAGTPGAQVLVGSGHLTLTGQSVRIVDPQTCCVLPEGQIGEIWLGGGCICLGYWNRETETRETVQARTAAGEGPYLRTGDLGFLREGQIFVTGRIKDVIIIRGRNYYPQDIEQTAERAHPAIRPGCVAACAAMHDEREQLLVVAEVRAEVNGELPAIADAVRWQIHETHGISPSIVSLIEARAIKKTSSGKVARAACREAYQRGRFPLIYEWRDPLQAATLPPPVGRSSAARVLDMISEILGHAPAADRLTAPIEELGIDSLELSGLAVRVERQFGLRLADDELHSLQSIQQLVHRIDDHLARRPAGSPT